MVLHLLALNYHLPLRVSYQSQICHLPPQVGQIVQHLLSQLLLVVQLQFALLVYLKSAGLSKAVVSSLVSAGAPVVLVSKLYCWSREAGKFR